MRKVFTLDADQVDEITRDNLGAIIAMLDNNIHNLYKKNNLSKVEDEDLRDHIDDLSAARHMYKYFGGKEI